jgi:hypothetical protein
MRRVWLVLAMAACSSKGSGKLDGVSYKLDLPSGFSLERELPDRITWKNADGFEIELYTTHMWEDGTPVPCDPPSDNVGTSSTTTNGVEREDAIFIHRCVDGHHVTCAGQRRDALKPGEHDTGVAICKTLVVS